MSDLSGPSTALSRINWDFPGAGNTHGSVHKTHWFPGNFIPQIPSALIQALSRPGDVVFDPFSGSGTTGIEALRLGRRAIISDRMSACVLIAAGKLALAEGKIDNLWKSEILAELTWESRCRRDAHGKNGEGSAKILKQWYSPETLRQLNYLWHMVELELDICRNSVLLLIFSDVLFACASSGVSLTSTGRRRRHHWGWVADNVAPRVFAPHNAIKIFEEKLASVPLAASSPQTQALILQQDARELAISSDVVDLVVTSPPYVNVIDYSRSNRLLYAWLGWDMESDRAQEIGARFKRTRKAAIIDYLRDMHLSALEIQRVLRAGGYCAMVIGASRSQLGVTDTVLQDVGKLMPVIWGPIDRRVSRRRVSERDARESSETLCVFQKR